MVSFGISPIPALIHSGNPQYSSGLRAGFQAEDLTVRNLGQETALHIASSMGKENIVRDLLELEPKLLNMEDDRGRTPLCLAATEAVIRTLLDIPVEVKHSELRSPPDVDSCESEVLYWKINGSTPVITWLIQRFDDEFILWLLQTYKIKCLDEQKQRMISLDDWIWKFRLEGDAGTISLISTALRAQRPKTFNFLTRALGEVEYEALDGNIKFNISSDRDVDTMLQEIKADQGRRESWSGVRLSPQRLSGKAAVWHSLGVSEAYSMCTRHSLSDCLEESSESSESPESS